MRKKKCFVAVRTQVLVDRAKQYQRNGTKIVKEAGILIITVVALGSST